MYWIFVCFVVHMFAFFFVNPLPKSKGFKQNVSPAFRVSFYIHFGISVTSAHTILPNYVSSGPASVLSLCVQSKERMRCSRKCYLFRSVSVVVRLSLEHALQTCQEHSPVENAREISTFEGSCVYELMFRVPSWASRLRWMNINGAFKLNWICQQRQWFNHVEKRTILRQQIVLMNVVHLLEIFASVVRRRCAPTCSWRYLVSVHSSDFAVFIVHRAKTNALFFSWNFNYFQFRGAAAFVQILRNPIKTHPHPFGVHAEVKNQFAIFSNYRPFQHKFQALKSKLF